MKLRLACLALTGLSMSVAAWAQSRPHAHGAAELDIVIEATSSPSQPRCSCRHQPPPINRQRNLNPQSPPCILLLDLNADGLVSFTVLALTHNRAVRDITAR